MSSNNINKVKATIPMSLQLFRSSYPINLVQLQTDSNPNGVHWLKQDNFKVLMTFDGR